MFQSIKLLSSTIAKFWALVFRVRFEHYLSTFFSILGTFLQLSREVGGVLTTSSIFSAICNAMPIRLPVCRSDNVSEEFEILTLSVRQTKLSSGAFLYVMIYLCLELKSLPFKFWGRISFSITAKGYTMARNPHLANRLNSYGWWHCNNRWLGKHTFSYSLPPPNPTSRRDDTHA